MVDVLDDREVTIIHETAIDGIDALHDGDIGAATAAFREIRDRAAVDEADATVGPCPVCESTDWKRLGAGFGPGDYQTITCLDCDVLRRVPHEVAFQTDDTDETHE